MDISRVGRVNREVKVLITGANGLLGSECVREFLSRGHHVFGLGTRETASDVLLAASSLSFSPCGYSENGQSSDCVTSSAALDVGPGWEYLCLDITDRSAVMRAFLSLNPDAVVHCAAWTAVDAAEEEANRACVERVNHFGTRNLAEAAREIGAKMVYISTDYVFDGSGSRPWKPDDKTFAPLNWYGETKLRGEQALQTLLEKFFIIRTSWVFGTGGKNFVKTMINVGRRQAEVSVVTDQIGTPTYAKDLSRLVADMAETGKYGYYHATNEGGFISWYDFCFEAYRQMGLETKIFPVLTKEYGFSKARRPMNSRLDKSKLREMRFDPLPGWKNALERYLAEEFFS